MTNRAMETNNPYNNTVCTGINSFVHEYKYKWKKHLPISNLFHKSFCTSIQPISSSFLILKRIMQHFISCKMTIV